MPISLNKPRLIVAIVILLVISVIVMFALQKEPEPTTLTVQEKKARFIALMVPAVNHVYSDLMAQYKEIKSLIDSGKSNSKIEKLKADYKVDTDALLLLAIKPHPKSIALAQAAMESSWATSRFFNEANNVFGVWSFNKDEPRIAAGQKRGDKTIWLKKYSSIEDSVYDYYRTLGRSAAFTEFRQAKKTTNDPLVLVTKLDRYSEKGDVYGEELMSIITFNQFEQYD